MRRRIKFLVRKINEPMPKDIKWFILKLNFTFLAIQFAAWDYKIFHTNWKLCAIIAVVIFILWICAMGILYDRYWE